MWAIDNKYIEKLKQSMHLLKDNTTDWNLEEVKLFLAILKTEKALENLFHENCISGR